MRAWKGPFVHPALMRRINALLNKGLDNQKGALKVWSRSSVILPEFIGIRFDIHNGKSFEPLEVKDMHVGHKVR
jgi:small subunit ribosomal protein S19